MPSSAQIGERIAQARKRLGLTQAALAEKLGLARTTVVALEKGERSASNAELIEIAGTLSIAVNDLVREHAVVAEASPRFRMGPVPRKAVIPQQDASVEELLELGRLYVELERICEVARTPAPLEVIASFHHSRVPATMDPNLLGAEAARMLRVHLGLGDAPARSLAERLELEAGFRVFRMDLRSDLAAILLWSDELGACVAINRFHPIERQRWSLAHELGHFLRDREAGDLLPAALHPRRDPSELFCEALAAELLMPASGLRGRFAETLRDKAAQFTVADLLAMAHFYEVSFEAMTRRLEELQLLPGGTLARLKRREFKPTAAKKELGLHARPAAGGRFPPRYLRLAFEAYENELLSEGDLARFLRCDRVQARGLYLSHRVANGETGQQYELDLGEDVLQPLPAS